MTIKWYDHYDNTETGRRRIETVLRVLELANPLLVEDKMSTNRDLIHPFERILQRITENPRDRAIRMEQVVLQNALAAYELALEEIEKLEKQVVELKQAALPTPEATDE